MSLPVVLRSEARTDLREATDWYQQQSGLGAEFVAEVQKVFDRIAATPELHPVIFRDARRAIVHRFPFNVIYRVKPRRIVIVAVIHNRRDPSVWQSRI